MYIMGADNNLEIKKYHFISYNVRDKKSSQNTLYANFGFWDKNEYQHASYLH